MGVLDISYEHQGDAAPDGTEIVPIIQNVVSTANLSCKLDLKVIAMGAKNAEYNPKRFAAAILRHRDPKSTALMFSSGKIVVTGAKDENSSRIATRKYAKIAYKLGFNANLRDFTIQNMVASCSAGFYVRLEGLAHDHKNYCNYEPELFPGLVYRMVQPKVVFLIFVSGKIVLTGAKTREDIHLAFRIIYPVLIKYRKGAISTSLPPHQDK